MPIGTVIGGLKQRLLDLHVAGPIETPALLVSALSIEDLVPTSTREADDQSEPHHGPTRRVAFKDSNLGQDLPQPPAGRHSPAT